MHKSSNLTLFEMNGTVNELASLLTPVFTQYKMTAGIKGQMGTVYTDYTWAKTTLSCQNSCFK